MDTRRKTLAELVRTERVKLKMKSQPALAAAADISPRKVSDVERGEFAGPKTYAAIEHALRWPAGSMQSYLDGGPVPPSSVDDAVSPSSGSTREEFSPELRERWRGMTVDEILDRGVEIGEALGVKARIRYLRAALQEKEDQMSREDIPH